MISKDLFRISQEHCWISNEYAGQLKLNRFLNVSDASTELATTSKPLHFVFPYFIKKEKKVVTMLDSLRPTLMKYKNKNCAKSCRYFIQGMILPKPCSWYSPRKNKNKKNYKNRLSQHQPLGFVILQFRLGFQQWNQFLCQHNVAGNFQFSLHECHLWIKFTQRNIDHILIGNR